MDCKEKAKELVDIFQSISGFGRFSKLYALICVDEIISTNPMSEESEDTGRGLQTWYFSDVNYWEEVKEEINKL